MGVVAFLLLAVVVSVVRIVWEVVQEDRASGKGVAGEAIMGGIVAVLALLMLAVVVKTVWLP